jgi:MoxR-like ATPase
VAVDDTVAAYCVALATASRDHQHTMLGASPRGSLALMLVGRAHAILRGRDYLTPEDVKAVAIPVLSHRITVRPELWMSNVTGRTVVESILATVATPSAREARPS